MKGVLIKIVTEMLVRDKRLKQKINVIKNKLGGEKKKLFIGLVIICISVLVIFTGTSFIYADTIKNYGDVSLSGGFQSGNFSDIWDLTKSDIVVTFTYDANGLVDDFGGNAHAWAQLGVRAVGYSNFNPTWDVEGAGVWLATDYDWAANTFDPDPVESPTLDMDDKLILQKAGGHGEGDYNLPSTPPAPNANHRIWWDRDGVDPYQNGETANTGGIYNIVLTLHANDENSGTAYMSIRGLDQGFETDGNWNTIELTPAGMTFTGDMKHMQIFYGLYGDGATHNAAFKNIAVTGSIVETAQPTTTPNYVQQTVGAGTDTVNASGAYATVTGSGGQTVTIEGITSGTASAGGFYIEGATTYVDLHINSSEGIEQIKFTILGGAGIPRWWDGSVWIECSDYTIDASGNVTVTITNSTSPSLSDLTGTVFTVFGKPWVRTMPMTCWQVWVNEDNNFQSIFLREAGY